MKISHEIPLCLLDKAYVINNYDYLLPHLTDKYSEYNDYFLQARKNGRFIIADNGLFENITHTKQDLIDKINKFKPDIFLTPDFWNDMENTYLHAKRWMKDIKSELPKNTNLMAVIQATKFSEAEVLYEKLVDLGYKHIAFNHSSIMYEQIFPHTNKLISQMMGRILLISKLEDKGIIRKDIYHHLLGASLVDEFKYYIDKPYIKSVDSSNPITYAIEFGDYDDFKEIQKPKLKIDDIMETKLSDEKYLEVQSNILKFRENCFQWE